MTAADKYEPLRAILCGVGFTALVACFSIFPRRLSCCYPCSWVQAASFLHWFFIPRSSGPTGCGIGLQCVCLLADLLPDPASKFWLCFGQSEIGNSDSLSSRDHNRFAGLYSFHEPVWPRGMEQLEATERKLRDGPPLGVPIESARSFLQKQGVITYEDLAQN